MRIMDVNNYRKKVEKQSEMQTFNSSFNFITLFIKT